MGTDQPTELSDKTVRIHPGIKVGLGAIVTSGLVEQEAIRPDDGPDKRRPSRNVLRIGPRTEGRPSGTRRRLDRRLLLLLLHVCRLSAASTVNIIAKFQKTRMIGPSQINRRDEWCSRADGLGTIFLIAVAIIGKVCKRLEAPPVRAC